VLQPSAIANGIVGSGRVSRLSHDSAFTRISLESGTVEDVINRTFLRILSRKPTGAEMQEMVTYLKPGFDQRKVDVDPSKLKKEQVLHAVSWSNHLNAEATRIKMEMERLARAGDTPTPYLDSDWRERMEDVVWTLINSPEFVFKP